MQVFRACFAIALVSAATITKAQSSDPANVVGSENNDTNSCDLRSLQPSKPWSVNARQDIVAVVKKSNECLAQKALECVEEALASMATSDQSDDERALLTLQRAELAHLRGEREMVDELYTQAMSLPALHGGLKRTVVEKFAERLVGYGQFRSALRLLEENFDCDTWTGDALALRGIAYQSISRPMPALALESFEAALRLYGLEGKPPGRGIQARYESLAATVVPPAAAPDADQTADTIPIARIPPAYPPRAFRRNVEGWVQLQFTISETGTVENARVVASSDEVFEKPAIAALEQWRYSPKTVNGLAVRREGVATMMRFEIYK